VTGLSLIGIAVQVVYGGLLAASAVWDFAYLRIPNLFSLLLAGVFLIAAILAPRPVNWISHIGAGAIVLVVGIGLFAWGKIGGGDVKLFAAAALWNGLGNLPALLLAIGIIGGIVAIGCLVLRGLGAGFFLESRGVPAVALEAGKGIPYAIAIAAGCLLLLPELPVI
jgi:prepilin peptidase CpaA